VEVVAILAVLLELVALGVVVLDLLELVELQRLALQTPEAAVAVARKVVTVAQAALASSSSRPINNEDKWKPKSIGCMESTPQCTC